MELDEYWIGDRVVIIRSSKQGVFLGINKGKARIRVDGSNKILLIPKSNITPFIEPSRNQHLQALIEEDNAKIKPSTLLEEKLDFIPEIDLHINKLQPSKEHENPIAILEFQIRKLQDFMDRAVALKLPKVTVIHGKGTGALRMETMGVIDSFPEKESIYPINNNGGMIVYLRYNT